ncbi:hypothetical protein MTR67_042443 [Solanum verrucosum]|uniref:LanC-like protein GCL2 n=1 Tax=Solanum verrucosum TaxID=315347 RepID=A0AAF0ULY3_SOLVR|nr:hypothetical protein MTR67_042443 [Solanum verrucosum]
MDNINVGASKYFRIAEMADRFYPNVIPDFVAENPAIEEEQHPIPQGTNESLLKLLSTPYHILSEKFKRAALDLKETIVVETWGLTKQQVPDFTLYCGTLGTAFLLFKAYQVTKNTNDLAVSSQIVKDCDSASRHSRDVTFLCGRAGVCALGAVVAKYMGDDQLVFYYVSQFKEALLRRLWYPIQTYPFLIVSKAAVINEIIKNGRKLGGKGRSPLMHEWYGEMYWGAAHGLAGIMHVLMDFELKPDDYEDVKGTLKYMVKNRFPSGNYPASENDRRRDLLVHWCHGAPGIVLTLVKAAEVLGDEEFLNAAVAAAEVVWNRGLLNRVGICHGISGNAYAFLSLYRLTGNVEYLYRAKAFACFLLDRAHKLIAKGEMHGGDTPYSLFEGIAGMAYLFLDMTDPKNARFPAYE